MIHAHQSVAFVARIEGSLRRLVSVLLGLAILVLIYRWVDWRRVVDVLRQADPVQVGLALALTVPLTLLTAVRLKILMPAPGAASLGDATAMSLAAGTLNLVLPAKMGDIAKAYFIARRGAVHGSVALALVLVEKGWDVLALLAWCLIGLGLEAQSTGARWLVMPLLGGGVALGIVLVTPAIWRGPLLVLGRITPARLSARWGRVEQALALVPEYVRTYRIRIGGVALISLGLWVLHLAQIWWFTRALGAPVPFTANLWLAALAIFAGLVPLTFAGVGTRDAAVIALYAPYLDAPGGAALGLLFTARYVLPGLAGLPYLRRYLVDRALPRIVGEAQGPP